MKIDFNRVDDLNARMTIVIEQPDYAAKLDENLKNYSKKVNLKGFRSGKTPKSVLTKMYGKGMLEESVSSILNERLFKYLEEEKIDIFGSPMMAADAEPVHFDPKVSRDYTFTFDLGLKPAFDLNYKIEEPLDVMTIQNDPETMEKEIKHYRRVFGTEEKIEDGPVQEGDRVEVSLKKTGSEDEPVQAVVDLERAKENASARFVGQNIGASFSGDLEDLLGYQRDFLVKNKLKLQEDPSPAEPLLYDVEITGIFRPQQAELTGEQITKYVGQQVEDEAGFRKILEDRENKTNQSRTHDMKKMAIRAALLKANPFEIPEEFLLKWVNSQRDKKIEPGSREANNLFRDAKWSLLLNRISADAGLEVTEKDVQKQVTNWIIENVNYMQTDIRKLMKELYENEYFMSTMKENALEEVVFAHIMPEVQFVEREGTPKEFEHAYHDLHHELFDHGDHSHHSHD